MSFMSPHPRNDQSSYRSESYDGRSKSYEAESKYTGSSSDEHGSLPHCSITPERLEQAKRVLENSALGVSSRDILASVIELPWIFGRVSSLKDLAVTERLVQLNPELASRYKTMRDSEGILAKLYASLPFVTDSRASTQFLRSVACLNELIDNMVKEGLVNANYQMLIGTSHAGIGRHPAPIMQSLMISATDFGQVAIRFIE